MKNRLSVLAIVLLALGLVAQTQLQDRGDLSASDNWRFSWLVYQDEDLKISVDQVPDHNAGRDRLRTFIQVEQDYTFVQLSERTAQLMGEALLDVETMTAGPVEKIGGIRLAFVDDPDDGFRVHVGGSEMFGVSLSLDRAEAVVVRSHLLRSGELIQQVREHVRVGQR